MNTTLDWIKYAVFGVAVTLALFALASWKVSAATGWMYGPMQNAECRMQNWEAAR